MFAILPADPSSTGAWSGASRTRHHRSRAIKVELHCQYCERRFTKSYNLLIHERSHATEEYYFCDICGKGFSKQYGLYQHRSQHSPSGSSSSGSSSP